MGDKIKLYVMESAYFDIDRSVMTVAVGMGEIVRITTTFALLEHPKGNTLIDTGLNKQMIDNVEEAWGTNETRLAVPEMTPEMAVPAQLAAVGLKPEDIRYVVLTHLHQDHTGGNLDVPDAKFFVQRKDMEYAAFPDIPAQRLEFNMEEIAPDKLDYVLLDGEYDLFRDGSVTMFPTPGHTPGSQTITVQLADTGPVMLVGDAIWTVDVLDEMTLPGICWCASEFCRSRQKIKLIAEQIGAKMIHAHEPRQFEIWKKSPGFHT
jgi:N-acyl homoserine lactone hydrolase